MGVKYVLSLFIILFLKQLIMKTLVIDELETDDIVAIGQKARGKNTLIKWFTGAWLRIGILVM